MICVAIAQESRRLALVDMINAAMLGADLIEVQLDAFEKDASLSELLTAKRKPLLFSCRRPQDGGSWKGTEAERQMFLRQAILSKADYVEIELDIADDIRPFPGCQRVISYTNLKETPADIAKIYAEMQTKKPDVIKLTCRARTPEEAWPLVQLLAKPAVPTVVVGLGRPGVMLAILGRKIGAPWTVAALESGMETYPGQPTIRQLEDVYRYREIGKSTRLYGVTGLGEREYLTAGLLNTAFEHLQLPHKVLPMQVGNLKLFRKIIDAVKLQGVTMEEGYYESLHEAAFFDESARPPVQGADRMIPGEGGWTASNSLGNMAIAALESTMKQRDPDNPEPLKGRMVMLAGTGPLNRMLAVGLKARGASLIWAGKVREAVQKAAQSFGGRQVAWEGIYTTTHDVLILGRDGSKPEEEPEEEEGEDKDASLPVHPGYLKPGMTILDLTSIPQESKFLREARLRGCAVVSPRRLLLEQVRTHVHELCDKEVPIEILEEKLNLWFEDTHEEEI